MLNVKITVTGGKETIARLQKMGDLFDDWEIEFKKIGDYLKNFYQGAVFESEGGIFGARWQRLKPKYDFYKRLKFPGRGILEATGTLRKGFDYVASKDRMVLSNKIPYAKFHQFGTRKMVARPLIKLDEARKDYVINVFKEGLERKIQTALKSA